MNHIIFLLLKIENGSHRPEHHTRVKHSWHHMQCQFRVWIWWGIPFTVSRICSYFMNFFSFSFFKLPPWFYSCFLFFLGVLLVTLFYFCINGQCGLSFCSCSNAALCSNSLFHYDLSCHNESISLPLVVKRRTQHALATASIDIEMSTERWMVNASSVNSFLWVFSLLGPQRNLSRKASWKWAPKSQGSDSFYKMATYCATLSPSSWLHLWKRNLSAIIIGFGEKWSFRIFTRSA